MSPKTVKIAAVLASVGAFLSFTLLDALVKVLASDYSALYISTYFRVMALFLMLVILLLQSLQKKSFAPFRIRHPYSHLSRGVLLAIISFAFTQGFALLPLNTGYAIVFLLPIVTAIFGALFLKEHITRIGLIAIIGGFVGVLVVLRPGIVPFSQAYMIGYLCLFAGILTEAPFFTIIRRYHKKENPFNVAFYPSVIAGIILVLTMWRTNVSFTIPPLTTLLIFFAGGCLNIAAQTLLVYALTRIKAHTSIGMQYSQIIWGTILGVFFFHDTYFDIFYLIGIIIIILSSYTVAAGSLPFVKKKATENQN